MKISFHYIILFVLAGFIMSCQKDNYDAPSVKLSGKIVYNGEAIQVEYNQVPFQVYQYGFGKVGAIDGTFDQNGSYSLLLFNGEYKFIIPNGQGPFLWKQNSAGNPDTVTVNLSGDKTMDLEVTPYYMIRTPQLAASSGKVTGTCKIEKIITDARAKNIENVTLYINKTQFVSGVDNIASASVAGSSITDLNNINLNVSIPAIVPTQNYVFARLAIKIAGVEDRIFTPVTKIQL